MYLPAADLGAQMTRVRSMLRPIARAESGPASAPQTVGGAWILGTHDGSPSLSGYRDWRFETPAPRHYAMYFEVWKPVDRSRYGLDRAYLNIYQRRSDGNEREILCLHCDPGESSAAPHAAYKRGPHLHLSFAEDPVKRSHLALYPGRVDELLSNRERLYGAMADAVQMIRDEVLDVLSKRHAASL